MVLVHCQCMPFTTNGCAEEFNEALCVYDVYCKNKINYNSPGPYIDKDECNSFLIHNIYNGGSCYKSNLKYSRDMLFEQYTQPIFYNNDRYAYYVNVLDLSNNEYEVIPPLHPNLENMATLNMSTNSLTKAVLSYEFEFKMLTAVDFSFNTINSIEVNDNEHPFRKLKIINLSHNYLVTIPDAIFDIFTELETLDLAHNYIDTLDILSFEGIKNLLYLYFSHNRISNINSAMLRFNKLKLLDLSHNRIETINALDFDKLFNLEVLDLSFNGILQIEKRTFDHLGQLTKLDVSNNAIEYIDKQTFINLTNLRNINLSKNNVKILQKSLFKDKNVSNFLITGNNLEGALEKGMFEGLKYVTELDLRNQQIASIEEFAFFGLPELNTLLLNNNVIRTLSRKSFKTLQKLNLLDLSNNKIISLDFEKEDLISLRSLLLQNNYLTEINHEYFISLNMLQYLDMSNNNISQLAPNSFNYLRELINFQISNNPITGVLEASTFLGLNSLPSLDISGTMLNIVNNGSFNGMAQLRDLNISHSKINELQFNSFLQTGSIETLDLSYNQLRDFNVNTTDLANLNKLLLGNNLLSVLSTNSFKGLPRLTKLILSNNNIENIDDDALLDQIDLRYLDLSFNNEFNFNISQIAKAQSLFSLFLSGIKRNITFKYVVQDFPISHLEMSYSGIANVTDLQLKRLKILDYLVLSNNDIAKVEVGAFSGVKRLRILDLSFNNISFIQPGAFKDNIILHSLNVSHNSLTNIGYGIFRGLIYLNTIDISYNLIDNLQSERFYEVRSLTELIADHNKIKSINADEFAGTSLSRLSIGDNPLPCELLVNLKKASIPFAITAIRLDENKDENVDGVTCNMDTSRTVMKSESSNSIENDKILIDIKDVLLKIYAAKVNEKVVDPQNNDLKYILNITRQIEKSGNDSDKILSNVTNFIVNTISKEGNNTNILLDRILTALAKMNAIRKYTPPPIPKENATYENLIPYINKIKQDLEDTIAEEKQTVLNEVDRKLLAIALKKESFPLTTLRPINTAALSNPGSGDQKSFLFIEICVALILSIIVVFILYKFYSSGMFVPRGRSYSTRNLPDAMENSHL